MSHVVIQDPNSISVRFSNKHQFNYVEESIEDFIEKQFGPEAEEDLTGSLDTGPGLLDYGLLERYLYRIPVREADLIRLYYKDKMKQEQIAKLFRITQAAVSYRLHRGIKRIQFLRTIPELEKKDFDIELGPKFSEQDIEILWRMYETTCQSEIAKQMNLTQGRVRHRFFRALGKIKELIANEINEKYTRMKMLVKHGVISEDSLNSQELLDNALKELNSAESELSFAVKASKYGKYYTVFYAISDKHFNILHEVSLPQFKDRGDAQILPIE
jgi:DNA-directed RNA polymerase specialized sigma24 family protein